jgi:hypothetical protein
MIYGPQLLLIGAVAAVGVLHTIVPDHWLPIALIARQRGVVRAAAGGDPCFAASVAAGRVLGPTGLYRCDAGRHGRGLCEGRGPLERDAAQRAAARRAGLRSRRYCRAAQGWNVRSIQIGNHRQSRHRAPARPNGDGGEAEYRPPEVMRAALLHSQLRAVKPNCR